MSVRCCRSLTKRIVLVFTLLVCTPGVARPDTPAAYERIIDDAVAEFAAGHFEEALAAFEQAHKTKPSARALRGAAKALFELRKYARCLDVIDQALVTEDDPLTETLRADLESLQTRARRFVGRVSIVVVPESAKVQLDGGVGLSRQEMSRGVALDVGSHVLDVTAADHVPQRRTFEVHGGEESRVAVALESSVPYATLRPVIKPTREDQHSVVPIVLGVGGVVASLAAVVGTSIWFVDRGDAVGRCNDAASVGASCANADSIAFQRNVATVSLSVSILAVAASAVSLWFVARDRGEPRRGSAVLR